MTRIAIDIDSTLHHYWDQLNGVAQRRFGMSLAYEEQVSWGITKLRPAQLAACVAETHQEALVLSAEPYPDAVETVSRWHAEGHFIHITSHRNPAAHDVTVRWLERIGLAYDELYCSFDKITRCVELEMDVLIDDSPVNLTRAQDAGLIAATIVHPWNAELVETDEVISGRTWAELATGLEPVLASAPQRA